MTPPIATTQSRPVLAPRGTAPGAAARTFLLRVAELLHAFGTPAHRLERVLGKLARALDVKAQFLSTPTSLMASFGEGEESQTRLVRIEPGAVDLGKLVEFDEVLEEVEHGRWSIERGLAQLESIAAAGPRYTTAAELGAFGLASATAASFFGGGWGEILVSFVLGVGIGVLGRLIHRRVSAVDLFDPVAGFAAALGAMIVARTFFPVSEEIVTLSGLIVLVPGLGLTIALTELATRHLVSGTARLAGAGTVFLTIVLGVALARRVGDALPVLVDSSISTALPSWTIWIAMVLAPLAFTVLFRARMREAPVIFLTCVLGFVGATIGARFLGSDLAPFVGALVVGLVSNLYARTFDRPSSVLETPGIIVLVPGSIGYRSLSFFLEENVLAGMDAAFQTILVAISLVGGLLSAKAILPPRRVL